MKIKKGCMFMNQLEQIFVTLLEECEGLFSEKSSVLPPVWEEYYKSLLQCAKCSGEQIGSIDPMYRVKLCQMLDRILDEIVDNVPFSYHLKGGIYTPAAQSYRSWNNVELLKDKCLAGYMMAKELETTATMYYFREDADLSLKKMLPELEIITKKEVHRQAYLEHLEKHYEDMDVLVLHGLYEESTEFLREYRRLRPTGKVFCGLDLNSFWMERSDWSKESYQQFPRDCDFLATSCTFVRDKLNAHPDFPGFCRYIPNGFLQNADIPLVSDGRRKENTILTVGRIGAFEKNNEELVLGFVKIADQIPDWNLKLVGTVEDSFHRFLKTLLKKHPLLQERIIVTGPIMDKSQLYEEYAKAKIFAITSRTEGGTPNVYAEALFHGCKIFTSKIDAVDDMTNHGALGVSYTLSKLEEFGEKMLELCQEESEEELDRHIQAAVAYGNRVYSWERNAKKIAYGIMT